jgi:hypothetical protein
MKERGWGCSGYGVNMSIWDGTPRRYVKLDDEEDAARERARAIDPDATVPNKPNVLTREPTGLPSGQNYRRG